MSLFSLKNISFFFKLFTSLDVKTEQFKVVYLLIKYVSLAFLLFSTTFCMRNNETKSDFFTKYHELLLIVIMLIFEASLIKNKSEMCKLINFLMEPVSSADLNSAEAKILEDYERDVSLNSKMMLTFYVIYILGYSALKLQRWLVFDNSSPENEECIEVALGWVRNSSWSWYIILAHFVSGIIAALESGVVILWFGVKAFAVLKIKMLLRILCADVYNMNTLIHWLENESEPGPTCCGSTYWEESSLICTAAAGENCQMLESDEPKLGEVMKIELEKQRRAREILQMERIKQYIGNIVTRHCSIIELVKLTDKTFRFSILLFLNLVVILVATAVPKLSLGKELMSLQFMHRGVEIFGIIVFVGTLCYIGQTLLDQSEAFRQALYNCDWTDKPRTLRRDLLVMQIVASRPLRLTVGGIYALNMETYSNLVSAAYSYISLIQSLM